MTDEKIGSGLMDVMGLQQLANFVAGLRRRLTEQEPLVSELAFSLRNLHEFETLTGAVEHLWSLRVRGEE